MPIHDAESARTWAQTVLRVLDTPWPWASGHVSLGADDCDVTPARLHPCFHGSLDWHSSCHMQWSAIVLLDEAELPDALAEPLAATLTQRLTIANAQFEVDYLRAHPGFERPYGWAWAVVLAARAAHSAHPDAERWAASTALVAGVVADLVADWLPRQALPVRHGTHQNSAFALALLRDGFDILGRRDMVAVIDLRACDWFDFDVNYPTQFEPSGTDFLSPALCEADLMRRALPAEQFDAWLAAFAPRLGVEPDALLTIPPVLDEADGHLVHLYGLGLSRAGQLRNLARHLPADRRPIVLEGADRLALWAAGPVDSGDFMSTHWLVSFALRAEGWTV